MDDGRKLDLREQLGKLSPKERIFEELDRASIQENIYGFIPASDCADTSLLIVNLGVMLAEKGKSVCIFDAKVFYPSIYKLVDCEANPKGKGLLQIIKSDKTDVRDAVTNTRYKNLYIMTSSPSDPMEEYFDIREEEVERIIASLKDMFDIVLIDIPNLPPLEFCYVSMKCSNMGFVVWSERIECPQNTSRLMHFMNSIGIGTSKFANIIVNNEAGLNYDLKIVEDMNLRLITRLPFVPSVVDYSLEGKVYVTKSVLMDRRYSKGINILVSIIK